MAILFQTAKFKSANTQFGGKPPSLMTANISGYTVVQMWYQQLTLNPLTLITTTHTQHPMMTWTQLPQVTLF